MQKVIQCDTRQKLKHHEAKERYFESAGYRVIHSKCLVGDYQFPNRGDVSVDTKKDIQELYGNLIQDHERFRAECRYAQDCGIQLYVLVENKDGITDIDGVKRWKNPRMYAYYKKRAQYIHRGLDPPKPPASNIQLVKLMHTMEAKYGVTFLFCKPEDAGRRVLELLGEELTDGC